MESSVGLFHSLIFFIPANSISDDIAPKPLDKQTGRKLARIPEETRERSAHSDVRVPVKRGPARQLDGAESEWKYRGRAESEDAEPQPLSAPTGLDAQKDEGFQRFYKAVVSPTHVRVTAGGHIVRNNRAPPSPTPKWSTNKTGFEGPFVHQRGPPEQNPYSVPPGPFGTYAAMYPGFIPGVNPPIPAGAHPYPMIPWHLGMNPGGNFAIPMGPGSQIPPSIPALGKVKDSSRSERQSESGVPDKPNLQYGAASEQFDHGRPAFYNGQWMMPTAAQLYPFAFPPPHGFPGAPFPMPMIAPRGIATDPPPRGATAMHNQSAENDNPHSAGRVNSEYAPPSNPPVSSIRPSDITRRQLEILRVRLKYLEDQLSYNKHQIDERTVENDAQITRQHIGQFEKNLEIQLSIEESQYPKSDQQSDLGEAAPSSDGMILKPSASGEVKANSTSNDSSNGGQPRSRSRGQNTGKDKTSSRLNVGINSTKSASAFAGWKAPRNSPAVSDQLNVKSTLPVGAAMAAPFQPRTDASAVVAGRSHLSQHQDGLHSGTVVDSIPAKKEHLGGEKVDWHVSAAYGNQDTPYLVGYIPFGIRPHLAKDTDYTYSRPLTEDELRARHMYWGKTPRHLQKGLPKFNGKDFFPPSPDKHRSSDETSSAAFSVGEMPLVGAGTECCASAMNSGIDPFQGLGQSGQILTRNGPGHSTQSESLPRRGQDSTENLTATTSRTAPYGMRVGRSLDDQNRDSQETAPTSSDSLKDKSSSDEAEDDRELIFTGRRTMAKPVYV